MYELKQIKLIISAAVLQVQKIQEVAIGNFIPHPAMVVALTLTTIRTEMCMYKCTCVFFYVVSWFQKWMCFYSGVYVSLP